MDDDLRIALRLAYTHGYSKTTEAGQDSILRAMASHLPTLEAEAAAKILHHRAEARDLQLHLSAHLEGIGGGEQ